MFELVGSEVHLTTIHHPTSANFSTRYYGHVLVRRSSRLSRFYALSARLLRHSVRGMSAVIAGGPTAGALMPPLGCVLCHAWTGCHSEYASRACRHMHTSSTHMHTSSTLSRLRTCRAVSRICTPAELSRICAASCISLPPHVGPWPAPYL